MKTTDDLVAQGMSKSTVLRAIHAGQIKAVRFGRRWRIPDDEYARLTTGGYAASHPGSPADGTPTRDEAASSGPAACVDDWAAGWKAGWAAGWAAGHQAGRTTTDRR